MTTTFDDDVVAGDVFGFEHIDEELGLADRHEYILVAVNDLKRWVIGRDVVDRVGLLNQLLMVLEWAFAEKPIEVRIASVGFEHVIIASLGPELKHVSRTGIVAHSL